MDNVVEIVTFKLLENTDHEQLIEASKQSQKFIANLPGFQYRSTSYNSETDTWTDIVYWDSLESAKAASEKFDSSPDCQPLMALIDPQSVDMQHQSIKMDDLAVKYQKAM